MVWENVLGVLSTDHGEYFRTVLEETARVVEADCVIPRPPKGKWLPAGCIMGDGWSIAWRVHNSQFWGVAQHRRRLALVADYGGFTAPEILFERQDMPGNLEADRAKTEKGPAIISGCAEAEGVNTYPWVYYVGNGQSNIPEKLTSVVGALNCMHDQQTIMTENQLRRLTPLECERLQGYPDYWTDIGTWYTKDRKPRTSSDRVRYAALGNSIALPFWKWMLERLSHQFTYTPTMASLFDGIGGFPYIWEQINGKGTCLWASEIDEFAIAVTNARINGGGLNARALGASAKAAATS